MLLASNFVLNANAGVEQHIIYPFVNAHSNVARAADRLMPVAIPDVDTCTLWVPVANALICGARVSAGVFAWR
jgi:hypothetical protein